MQTQESLVVPILEKYLGVKVESKDLTDPTWDFEGMDKLVRPNTGGSYIMAVRSRTSNKRTYHPNDVTVRTTELRKLNARYYFYGTTDSPDIQTPARKFHWWIIWHIQPFRERLDGHGPQVPDFEIHNAPDSPWGRHQFLVVPIVWLLQQGYLAARYVETVGFERFAPFWNLTGANVTVTRLDDFR